MKKLIALALTAVFAVSLVGCGTTAESSSLLDDDFEETTEVETTEVPTTFQKTTTMSPAEREATYKELCDEYDYDDVLFAPDRYEGMYCKFTGTVSALCKDDGTWFVLKDKSGNLIDVHGDAEYYERNQKVEIYRTIREVKSTYYSDGSVIIVDAKYVDFV